MEYTNSLYAGAWQRLTATDRSQATTHNGAHGATYQKKTSSLWRTSLIRSDSLYGLGLTTLESQLPTMNTGPAVAATSALAISQDCPRTDTTSTGRSGTRKNQRFTSSPTGHGTNVKDRRHLSSAIQAIRRRNSSSMVSRRDDAEKQEKRCRVRLLQEKPLRQKKPNNVLNAIE